MDLYITQLYTKPLIKERLVWKSQHVSSSKNKSKTIKERGCKKRFYDK